MRPGFDEQRANSPSNSAKLCWAVRADSASGGHRAHASMYSAGFVPRAGRARSNPPESSDDETPVDRGVDEVARSHGVSDELRGLTLRHLNIVMVRWSPEVNDDGEWQPDFEALGHEVWHCIKGVYHE